MPFLYIKDMAKEENPERKEVRSVNLPAYQWKYLEEKAQKSGDRSASSVLRELVDRAVDLEKS